MKPNTAVVDLNHGFGAKVRDEADAIVQSFGSDPTVTLNALVFVLGLLIGNLRTEVQDHVIDGIASNIRMNMGASESPIQ